MGIRVSRERGRPARSGPQAHGRSSGRDARAPGNPARGIGTAHTSSFLGEVARSLPVEMPGARSGRQTCLDCDKRIGTRLAKPAKVNDPIIPYRCELGAAIGNSVLDTSFWPTVAQVYLSRTVNLVRIVERNRELNASGIGTYTKKKIEVRRGECATKPGGIPDFTRTNALPGLFRCDSATDQGSGLVSKSSCSSVGFQTASQRSIRKTANSLRT